MKLEILAFALAMGAAVPALASEKFVPGPENKMNAKDVLTVTVPWIKDKGSKFDVNIVMQNDSADKSIVVFLSDMNCGRGAQLGQLKHTFFNTGERTIDFHPKQTKSFNLVCNYGEKTKGDFKLSIAKVYDNPSNDGKTVGKVLAKDLNWTQSDRRE